MDENRLLVIDDQPEVGTFVTRVAHLAGYEAVATTTANSFRNLLVSWKPTHAVMDLMVPDVDGIELIRFLAELPHKPKLIIFSGAEPKILESARRLAEARGLKIVATISKPVRAAVLRAVLDGAKVAADWLSDETLERALEEQQFFLMFQPKVVLPSRALAGFEALLRWRHPQRGLVPPADFIAFAEESPLIDRLTLWVVATALGQLREWRSQGLETTVAVNVSGKNLRDLRFADRVLDLCRQTGISPQQLTLELTETAVAKDAAAAMDILTRIRLRGAGLAIDDFGTAFSSLVQLQRLPFSEIKIDRTFVAECLESESATVIIKTIIGMAHNLGMKAVAEGIENQAVLERLADMGCDEAQGYGISRPLEPAAVSDWVQRSTPGAAA